MHGLIADSTAVLAIHNFIPDPLHLGFNKAHNLMWLNSSESNL